MAAGRSAETVIFPIVSPLKAKTATVELADNPSTIVAKRGFPEKTLKVKLETGTGGGVVGGMVVVGVVGVVGGMVVVGVVVVVAAPPITSIAQAFSAVCFGILLSVILIMASFIPSVEYDLVTIESEPERLSVPDQE